MSEAVNIHGRRGGRGIRPWLLLPKIVCVGTALGAAVSALVLWLGRQSAGGLDVVDAQHVLLAHVMAPGVAGAVVFGILLWLQHPRVLARQRWLRVKVALAVVLLPLLHLAAHRQLEQLRTLQLPLAENEPPGGILVVLLSGVGVLLILLGLGRLKPRLGQNWPAAFGGILRK